MSSRIYAAEDDDNIREILRCTLESYGYEVEVFESAAPMLERMRQQLPDLVLMDVCTEGGASGHHDAGDGRHGGAAPHEGECPDPGSTGDLPDRQVQ